MVTPKREFSFLETFPPDILAYIVWYLPGEQLGRLLMTGATFLWQRLKFPSVVKSVTLGKDLMIFKSLPGFLHDFPSLDTLLIDSCSDQWSLGMGLTIESIPSGVRKLHLSGNWSTSAPKLFGEPDRALKLSKHLPHLVILSLYDLDIPDNSWMTHSPQTLVILMISHWDGTLALPSCLIHFIVNTINLSADSFVSELPSSLETFVAYNSRGLDLVVPLLPPTTRYLTFGSNVGDLAGSRSLHEVLLELPKSLTYFTVPKSPDLNFETHPERASLLPRALTKLNIGPKFPSSAWPLLPQHLTTLNCFAVPESLNTTMTKTTDKLGVHREVKSIPFDLLPRSLTTLSIPSNYDRPFFCGPPPSSNQAYFPPNLTKLKIGGVQLSPEAAQFLPDSLTLLEIANLCEEVCKQLPIGLKKLRATVTLLSPDLFKFLPSLTWFHTSVKSESSIPWFDYNTGERVSMTELPKYSLHKECLSDEFDWKDASYLPHTLKDLSLQGELGDSFWRWQYLPNLLELDLEDCELVSDSSVRLLSHYHLTTLILSVSTTITGLSFKFLPRTLTHLDIDGTRTIFDSDIQHLPRTLIQIHCSKAIHLTDLCIIDLPRYLERLYMSQNNQITPSSLPHFPDPLQSSRFDHIAVFRNWMIERGVVKFKE